MDLTKYSVLKMEKLKKEKEIETECLKKEVVQSLVPGGKKISEENKPVKKTIIDLTKYSVLKMEKLKEEKEIETECLKKEVVQSLVLGGKKISEENKHIKKPILDLTKYSILKIERIKEKLKGGKEEFNLECIKTIDGNLLRQAITTTSKYIKISHSYLKINPKYSIKLFNNIKSALIYKLNDVTNVSYNSPLQTLNEHYIAMLSNSIFGVPTITEPFINLKNLNETIEKEINNMIYKFLDMDTYENNIESLNNIVELLNDKYFVLNFPCIIKAPSSLCKYNIKDTIWNIHVLVD
jgi:hypothetical protein